MLVKNEETLTDKEQAKLADLCAATPKLKELHQPKEAFCDIFEADHTRSRPRRL